MAATFLSQDEEGKDGTCWGPTPDGMFIVKSTYDIIRQNKKSPTSNTWKRIWKLNVPQKIRTFMWLLHHGRILTNHEKIRRGFSSNPNCTCCPDKVEDVDHLFCCCKMVQPIWEKMTEEENKRRPQTLPFRDWFCPNLEGIKSRKRINDWQENFAICLWWIWR